MKVKGASSLTPGELMKLIKGYFPSHPDLMMDLSVGALWEYHVRSPTLDDNEKMVFHLKKIGEQQLELGIGAASETPDLVLYFTDEAIVELMSGSPDAETYYNNYSKILKEGSGTRDLDYRVNKSRLQLWRVGYRNWANRYGFMQQIGDSDIK
jgi:hypothetical protein